MRRLHALAALMALVPVAGAEEAAAPLGGAGVVETIRERDAEGRVRVEREVRQNDAGDFVNHGVWRAWDAAGELAGQGRYAWGKPSGQWTRWAPAAEAEIARDDELSGFTAPFLSQATYRDGLVEGRWSVFDAEGRRVSEVEFRSGRRHGVATLWAPDGQPLRRSRFDEGLQVGDHEERAADGSLIVVDCYEAGRKRTERLEHHAAGGQKCREGWLGPLEKLAAPDDPWRLRLARYEPQGEPLRDGSRESWWPNGQPKLRAEYRQGLAIGEARWWHENGQLAVHGVYEGGLAAGKWSWWRETGVRAASCDYTAGQPAGAWSLAADGGEPPRPEALEQVARRPAEGIVR